MPTPYLTIVAKIQAKRGMEDTVRMELQKLVGPTHAEEGCVQYDLHESNTEPGVFLFFENWISAADLDRHLESAHIAVLKSKAETLLAKPIEISRWTKIS